MKIVAFSQSQFAALFPMEGFVPVDGLNERKLLDAITDRYNFQIPPHFPDVAEGKQTGLVFKMGFFDSMTGEVMIDDLAIHNDGVLIKANKTEHAEAFFEDLSNWLIDKHECRKVSARYLYLSEVVVDFEKPLKNALANYDRIVSVILSGINKVQKTEAAVFNSLAIEFVTNSGTIPRFIIERRKGSNAEDERYFCSAPLTTTQHLKVLEELERSFG